MNHSAPLLECVPNFSEGRDLAIIDKIVSAMAAVEGAQVLDVDPGRSTHRTVVTVAGAPSAVVEAAFRGIAMAGECIDLRKHRGEHPRIGATDVCPLIPLAGLTMAEAAALARDLAARVGAELGLPVYLYGEAALKPERRQLDAIRAGEYEGLPAKLGDPAWQLDFGPAAFLPRSGATVIGARKLLVAYNVNLNSRSTRRAFAVAYDVREQGRLKREGHPITGPVVHDAEGREVWIPGRLKGVKAVGWYIPEYGQAQVSMNLTDLDACPLHEAFEACRDAARERGLRVTGSELVGLVPLSALLDAGRFYLRRQERSLGLPERDLVDLAVKSLGLDDLGPFDPSKKVIEYRLAGVAGEAPRLADQTLDAFAAAVADENPAPGGGSVAAALGALAAALAAMVANVSANKRGWEDRWESFSAWAEAAEAQRRRLLALIDKDSRAFGAVLAAGRLPATTPGERAVRADAQRAALRGALEAPLETMREAAQLGPLLEALAASGAPDAASDAWVGVLCARTAVRGAAANLRINAREAQADEDLSGMLDEALTLEAEAAALEARVAQLLRL